MRTATVESASLPASPAADHSAGTGIYLRGKTFWIRYHGPRRNGSWGQICESARTSSPEEARRLREHRLHEVSDHREGIHLFRGPYQARSAFSFKS
ncbi:MAG TPA: hypothetical protein VGO79_12620 [Thermoanaerobaculia bacterium]|jgi:hypothetical protein